MNKYATRKDVGEQGAKLAFNTHTDASIIVCFTNTLSEGMYQQFFAADLLFFVSNGCYRLQIQPWLQAHY